MRNVSPCNKSWLRFIVFGCVSSLLWGTCYQLKVGQDCATSHQELQVFQTAVHWDTRSLNWSRMVRSSHVSWCWLKENHCAHCLYSGIKNQESQHQGITKKKSIISWLSVCTFVLPGLSPQVERLETDILKNESRGSRNCMTWELRL